MAQTTYPSNVLTSYSSFFSSGLLAQHTGRSHLRRSTFNSDISEPWDDSDDFLTVPSSPSRPSSPAPLPDDSVMDVDMNGVVSPSDMRRSATPTPQSQHDNQTTPIQFSKSVAQPTKATSQQPRLRRRRSSLTQATSPMVSIRSPARAAGNALHFQKQLPAVARSRSGSVSNDAMYGGGAAMETTSLVGRMRSGSCSSVSSLPNPSSGASKLPVSYRPRRVARRIPLQAPSAPPPNSPLPALPVPKFPLATSQLSSQQQLRPSNLNLQTTAQSSPSVKSPPLTSARARGLSVSKSSLDGVENRIVE